MKPRHIHFDYHSSLCSENPREFSLSQREYCEMNKQEVVIFIKNQFVLITYNKCVANHEYEFIQEISNTIHKNSKTKDLLRVERSVNINEDFRRNRLRGVQFKNYSEEVHYIYYSASRAYAITSKMKYLDYFTNRLDFREKYNAFIEYISDEKNCVEQVEYLKNCAEKLYRENFIIEPTKLETYRTVNNLITNLKKQL